MDHLGLEEAVARLNQGIGIGIALAAYRWLNAIRAQ